MFMLYLWSWEHCLLKPNKHVEETKAIKGIIAMLIVWFYVLLLSHQDAAVKNFSQWF